MADLQNPIFQDEDVAREALEAVRWPHGPNCPHCGNIDPDKISKGRGKVSRPGLYYCAACNGQFAVTVGTVMERSKINFSKRLLAMHLMGASKKGISAHQLHRMLGATYKTAWFMAHRIREAMKEDGTTSGPLGGEGKTIEADEAYNGRREDGYMSPQRKGRQFLKRKRPLKRTIVGLVERGGSVRTFHVQHATKASVRDVLVRNADRKSILYTDEPNLYTSTGAEFASHGTVKHSAKEYACSEGDVVDHANTIESVFSIFKRGMVGVYQHCGEAYLHRYLAEFDFRYNRRTKLGSTDAMRVEAIMTGIAGKCLTYRRIGEAQNA